MTTEALPRPAELASLPHSGLSVGEFYSMHFMGALIPLTAGLLVYGWRAAGTMLLVCGSTAVGVAAWRRIGPRGAQLSYPHSLWLGFLLAMMLPPHLSTDEAFGSPEAAWYILPAAGLLLAMLLWVLGGLGAGRIHPVLVAYLIIAALFVHLIIPHRALKPTRLLLGDVLNGEVPRNVIGEAHYSNSEPWYKRHIDAKGDAEYSNPASEALTAYTNDREKLAHRWLPIQSLVRDELPPMEDLVFAGHPSPIGTGSAIAVIIGGLFLLYRGLIDFRIPVIIILFDLAGLLILPTPALLGEHTQWHWIVSRQPEVGWGTGITFANYELLASPVLFMAFFLATAPPIRPMSQGARVLYAVVAGSGSAALQLYMSVAVGPYVALLLASLLTPALDLWFRPRAVI